MTLDHRHTPFYSRGSEVLHFFPHMEKITYSKCKILNYTLYLGIIIIET